MNCCTVLLCTAPIGRSGTTHEVSFGKEGVSSMNNSGHASKDELKEIARELLNTLRPRKLQIWQVKEIFRFSIELADQEQLK